MIHILDPDSTFKLSYVTFCILCVIFEASGIYTLWNLSTAYIMRVFDFLYSCSFSADDPYAVADKWLLKENLPLTYRQQVVEFILQNSGQNNFVPDPSFRDPYTGGKHVFVATVIFAVGCCCLLLTTKFDYVSGNAYVPGGQPSSSNGTYSISMPRNRSGSVPPYAVLGSY